MTQRAWPQPEPQPDLHTADLRVRSNPNPNLNPRLLLSVSPPMREQTLSQSHLSTAASVAAVQESGASAQESGASATTTGSTADAKIPFRPRKIRKVSSEGDPQQVSSSGSTKKATNSRAPLLRVVPRPLSADGEIDNALHHLRAADPLLARVIDAHDPPTFRCRHPPFHSLARSILYQQLALKAAASIYARFLSLCGGESGVVPEAVLALTPHQLRQIGVSSRKASYLHDLARKYHNGILSDSSIVSMDDRSLFAMLTMVKGIGAWSVHMFMIFSLHRPDVLPVGDLGVRKGVQVLYGLDDIPRPSQMEQLCEIWRPYRSVGAWYMWRLAESRGTPTMASMGSGTGVPITGGGEGTGGGPLPQQQAQLIDPIQMLPNLG
ncbi:alkylbase DNA glycosidase-like protein mag2 [Elaeis guineensis]|uniref:Probable DNA-3-methyladenine glycosylase 2 n=1 Tax=Elaeis guineensis var. tenera TaxID=51953 RepID=A0A6I9RG03_ELAGV|nr:probable DNA-3-methyladenine glycosylase 2 [Elaeis guineensis]